MESGIGTMIEKSPTDVSDGTEPEVIVLPEGDYGSLRSEEWSQLFRRLEQGLKGVKSSLVIVDMHGVRFAGASFLGALVNLANCLNRAGVQLQVRGDRFGLLERTGLEGKLSGATRTSRTGARSSQVYSHHRSQRRVH